MSEKPKQLKNEAGDPLELRCPKCGNTDPVLFDFIEDEPTRREAKLVRDDGTLVFEATIAQHYFEAATNDRLECRNEVLADNPAKLRHLCMTEIPMPAGMQIDFE